MALEIVKVICGTVIVLAVLFCVLTIWSGRHR